MIIGYRVLCCFELQASGLSMLAQVSGPCPKGVHLRSISKKEFTSALFFVSFPVLAAPKPGLPLEVPFGQRIQTNSLATQHGSP